MFAVPPALSANLGAPGAAAIGGAGGLMGTEFFITGFGMSALTAGNPIGYTLGGQGGAIASVGPSIVVGSGANDVQGPRPVTRNVVAQGSPGPATLNTLYIGSRTSTGGYVPGGALWEGNLGTPAPPAPPPVPPAPPPTPAPVVQPAQGHSTADTAR